MWKEDIKNTFLLTWVHWKYIHRAHTCLSPDHVGPILIKPPNWNMVIVWSGEVWGRLSNRSSESTAGGEKCSHLSHWHHFYLTYYSAQHGCFTELLAAGGDTGTVYKTMSTHSRGYISKCIFESVFGPFCSHPQLSQMDEFESTGPSVRCVLTFDNGHRTHRAPMKVFFASDCIIWISWAEELLLKGALRPV